MNNYIYLEEVEETFTLPPTPYLGPGPFMHHTFPEEVRFSNLSTIKAD